MSKRNCTIFIIAVGIYLTISSFAFAQDQLTEPVETGYASVNGLEIYYEIHGTGEPLVVIHGAYMSIQSMGAIIPRLAETRQVIAVELQGHGRTADIEDRPFSYEQLADDVAALMNEINLEQADIFGYSLGGGVALQIALRHPQRVDRLIVASAPYSSDGYQPGLIEMIQTITPEMFANTPMEAEYTSLAPNSEAFPTLVEKLVAFDGEAFGWSTEDIASIASPTLFIMGDADTVQVEHVVGMFRLLGGGVNGDLNGLPNVRLAVLPGTTHIGVLYRVDWLDSMITEFLDEPVSQ